MMLDATQKYDEPLTAERLFGWHAALFPTGRSGMQQDHGRRLARRQLRPDAGRLGSDRQASASTTRRRRPRGSTAEMKAFLDWFNEQARRSIPCSRPPSRICGS